jgi:hypothetical protein
MEDVVITIARWVDATNTVIYVVGDRSGVPYEVFVPNVADNRHRQIIAAWEALGNTIGPPV